MVSPDPALVSLAEAVSDGTDVDWARAESSAETESELRAIRQLRTLAGLASAARAQAEHWGPLQIRGEIGRGVFGVVYRAWDARLEREVALKLLPAPPAAPSGVTAAIKEGRLLAKIRHPNVVTVFGADEADGSIGIWMELIAGRTLRDIVTTYGPLGGPEAALIGRDLCRALAAVHRQGFVHRDVKAQNVMREAGGRTVLMDFGAGQALPEAGDAPSIVRGTPAYLAPEVLEGGQPSAQSDIYSLGVLLYFLVSGAFPVSGASFEELRARHASGSRTRLRDVRPDLPAGFLSVVDSCTAADPSSRPQTAGAVEALLNTSLEAESTKAAGIGERRPSWITASPRRRIAAALLAVSVLGAAAFGGWMITSPGSASVRRDSVAILPLRNLTAETDTAYFSEGITADLIASLSSLRDLRVIAGSSMSKYKDGQRSPVEIGKELGVATVLDASLRRSGDTVRIVAQLIDAASGEQIWSDSFDGRVADIIQMKSDVSHKIAVALRGELSQRDEEVLRAGNRYDPVAFDLYMKGHRQWLLGTDGSLTRSVQYFHDAVNRDPSFALAYTGIADAYYRMGANGMLPRDEAYSRALAAAEKAVQLDDSLAEAHASLAQARKNKFEWAAAERSFKRAIELKPGYAKARHWYSVFLTQHARFAEAIAEIRIAMSLDPVSKEPKLQLASVLSFMRRYDDALAQYEEALKMDAGFALTYRHMAQTLVDKGDFERASDLYEQARRKMSIGAEDQELKADLGYLFAVSGREKEALAIARELTIRYERTGEAVAGSIAAIYAGLDRRDAAMDWLEKAAATRDPETGYLRVEPRWDSLRAEPRFIRLLEQLGFTN